MLVTVLAVAVVKDVAEPLVRMASTYSPTLPALALPVDGSPGRRTYRKVMLVGLLFCTAFVVISFFTREQPANTYVLKKADRLVRSAGSAVPAN
jgi:hypothetical protein